MAPTAATRSTTAIGDVLCGALDTTGGGWTAGDAVASRAGAKYDAVIAKFVAFGCGGCGIANAPGLRTSAESFLDTKNGQVYCVGSTPF